MATAGSATVGSASDTNIYTSPDGCSEFFVACMSTSSNPVLVNIPGLHVAGEYVTLEVSKEMIFTHNKLGIKVVKVKGSGGDAIITYGVAGIVL